MSKTKILLVVLIGLALPLYILWKTISVSFIYSSIGEPLSGVKISFQKINGENFIVFPEEENYFFNQAKIGIFTKDDSQNTAPVKIAAYQNFLANLYPVEKNRILSEQTLRELLFKNNSTDIPIGGLFSDGDSVKILSQEDSCRTIFSAELFEKMNYKWEDVIKNPVGFSGNLTEGTIFNYGNPHPDGTFLKNDSELFLVWNQKLIRIDPEVNLSKISKISPIEITSIKPIPFGSCEVEINKSKVICDFEKNSPNIKSDYIFKIENLDFENIDKVSLKLSASLSKSSLMNNLKTSVENIKLKLIKRYRGYIPFI